MNDIDTAQRSLNALRGRFPYMFEGGEGRFDFYRGWLPITIGVCETIDALLGADKRHFHWVRIREKYGGVRLLFSMDGSIETGNADVGGSHDAGDAGEQADPIRMAIAGVIRKAVERSQETCMVCGDRAGLENYDGVFVTLCEKHRAKNSNDESWQIEVLCAHLGFE